MHKIKVLFLCTGNSARSQMAEALLRQQAGETIEVFSAGLEPKGVNPYTLRVLEEQAIPTANLTSKSLDVFVGQTTFDYLITVCSNAEERCPFFPGAGTRLHWPFEDPAAFQGSEADILARFRQVRDEINDRIHAWLQETQISAS